VTATNAIGTGPASIASNSVTPATVPDAPTAVTATPGNKQVSLTWISPVWNGGSVITDYVIEYKLTSGATWTVFADGISTANTVTVTGLTNNLSYDFRISAANAVGQSVVNATSATLPADAVSPNPPASSGGGGIISGGYIATTTPTTTPAKVLVKKIIKPVVKIKKIVPPTQVIEEEVATEVFPVLPKVEVKENEVTAVPTEKSVKLPLLVLPKITVASGFGSWWLIIIILASIALISLIIFLIRRRKRE